MNQLQSKNLQPGAIIVWDGNPKLTGTVVKVTSTAVYIKWADGDQGWLNHREMKKAAVAAPVK